MKSWSESWARESWNKQIPVVEGGRQLRDMLRCVITLCVVLKRASVHCLLRLPFQGAYTVLEKRTHYKPTDSSEHPPTTPVSHLSVSVYLPDSKYFPRSEYCFLLLRGDRRAPPIALLSPQMFLSLSVSPPWPCFLKDVWPLFRGRYPLPSISLSPHFSQTRFHSATLLKQ